MQIFDATARGTASGTTEQVLVALKRASHICKVNDNHHHE
jgi:hypothetical protein